MARKTATTEPPARPPRKPAGTATAARRTSGSAQGGTRAQKPATGRRTTKTTGPAKAPNKFDAIAQATAAGDDDLARQLAASISSPKGKHSDGKQPEAKPTKPAKVQANGNGKPAFSGRPVSNPAKVAERVKQLGLRVRSDADVDAIAARLRATPDAVSAWLATRNGKQPAKVTTAKPTTTKANGKPKSAGGRDRSEWLTGITLQHEWAEKTPDYLKGRTLVIRYQVKADGTVWSTLTQLREADGSIVPNFKDYPLDYRPTQERDGRNRPVILKGDLEGPALAEWLVKQGLASSRDIETSS